MIRTIAHLWVGLIRGVSFLATPIKFRAESLTLPVAVDVGRVTFHTFAKVEWILSFILLFAAIRSFGSNNPMETLDGTLLTGILGIVILQAFWLLPLLDVRVAAIIDGAQPPASHLHTVFAVLEFVKAAMLFAFGLRMR